MYLLYEKEYSDKVKEEQRRLLTWIKETVKLNPQSDISSILLAADGYVSYNSLKVEKRETAVIVDEPEESALVEDAEPEPVEEESTEDVIDETNDEEDDIDEPLLADEPEPLPHDEVLVEDFSPEVEEESASEEEIEETAGDEESTPENSSDEVAVEDSEDTVEEPAVSYDEEELKHISDIDEFFSAPVLPSREEEEEAAAKESQNKQMQLRDRHAAIFSDKSEIENL